MPRFTARSFGTCLSFSGNTQNVKNATGVTGFDTASTIALWVRTGSDVTTGQRIAAAGLSAVSTVLGISLSSSIIRGGYFNGASYVSPKSLAGILPFTWYHVVVTWDGATSLLYINGVSSATTGNNPSLFQRAGVIVGDDGSGTTGMIGGMLVDEVMVFARALSANDVTNLYYGGVYSTTSLWSYWKFDEGSGTSATDSSGNSNTGTITSATYTTNPPLGITTRSTAATRTVAGNRQSVRNFGTQLKFASGNYVNLSSVASLSTVNITFGCWVKLSPGLASLPHIINVGGSDSATLFINPATNIIQVKFNNIGGSAGAINFSTALQIGIWYHIVGRFDGTTIKGYLNGVEVATTNKSGAITYTDSSFFVGRDGTGSSPGSNPVIGFIDEPFIYNSALAIADIQNICYQGIYLPANQQLLWKFDEGSGTSATDSSGNSNTGTITGATYVTDPPLGITARSLVT